MTKQIEFFGNTYRQLTDRPFWTDNEFDALDKSTGEWVSVGPNDIVWLYDAGWQPEAYDGVTDCRAA
ncbi:hypothetical protein GFL93_12650 [Rhizobium leguminosarum bv. viciae]|uniref:hypothetical protein n=1 Tax=Rhizobium TaxID=379 RepID=UPI0014429862|nr:hypothetical protein [Rhizobium leguminosarum]NKK06710.1 hypothetical protein [Rhizobium leguminosarum bv. viciae]